MPEPLETWRMRSLEASYTTCHHVCSHCYCKLCGGGAFLPCCCPVLGIVGRYVLRSTELVKDARGIASLYRMLPLLVPFAQAFAAVITAALTGSLYYIVTAPKDPTYVVAPVLRSRSGRDDLKKLFAD